MSAYPLTGPATGRHRGWTAAVVALLLGTVALTAVGAVLAAGIVRSGDTPPAGAAAALPSGPFGVSQDVPTSFGAFAVENVQKVAGTTAKELGGKTHGISGKVEPNKQQIQTSVVLTNLTDRPVAYEPTQFRLLVGRDRDPARSVRSSLKPGTLQPSAAIDGRFTFLAPRTGSKLWLEFTDPGRAKPILVDLGKTGTTPDSAFDRFRHGGHSDR